MKISFNYTIEGEVKRVKDTIKRKDFFIENGYQPKLPEGLNFDNFSLQKAKTLINKEFDDTKVSKIKSKLTKDWAKNQDMIEAFIAFLPYDKPQNIKIIFTQYGMGGSYRLPDTILINLRNINNPLFIMTHELLHLIIEGPVVDKYKLSQWDKESLVDYLLNESKALYQLFPWISYQKKAPTTALLEKVGWDKLVFEKAKHPKKNPLVEKYGKEVGGFFEIPEVQTNIYTIKSRAEYNDIMGCSTEDWMVGFTRGRTVFILDKDKFEEDSSHPKSDFELVLKHEISHIYYRQLKGNGSPAWLNEGIACFIAGQNKKPPKEKVDIKTLEKYHNEGGAGIYSVGRYMVDQIVNNFGKQRLFELIVIESRKERYKALKDMFDWLK